MSSYVLDTGALVALQRDGRRLRAVLRAALQNGYELRSSAAVLTEFLGGSPPSLRASADYVSSKLHIGEIDEALSRRAAALMRTAISLGVRPGPIDALAAAEAERTAGALVIDGDRTAFEALSDASGSFDLVELNELAG